jgi:hypothetical protein
MTDPRNFLLNTDYPLDKIVYMTSGSISVPNGTSDITPGVTIPHNLPFIPLAIMLWSNTSDFEVCNESMDLAYATSYFPGPAAGQIYDISADATNLSILRLNSSGSAKTVYYRIFCFAPSNADIDSVVTATQSVGSNFIINTDYNYMKLVANGILTPTSTTYTHNLGYVPRVQIWAEFTDGTIERQIEFQDVQGSTAATGGVKVTTTTLEALNYTPKIHYRIYADA